MKLAAVVCFLVLGGGLVLAQEQGSGTVNSLSVDPQQNQKLSGSMGTETGQPNDVSRGADRDEQLGNPANSQISGQKSAVTNEQEGGGQNKRASKKNEVPGGSPATNQNSASTNSGRAPRRTDNRDSSLGPSTAPHR